MNFKKYDVILPDLTKSALSCVNFTYVYQFAENYLHVSLKKLLLINNLLKKMSLNLNKILYKSLKIYSLLRIFLKHI